MDLIHDYSNDVAQIFYRWLMIRDLTGCKPRPFTPTAAKQAMVNEARDSFDVWMQDVCLYPP